MSADRLRIELSEPARQDFRDILNYTLQKWGERQLVLYRDKVKAALRTIAAAPKRRKENPSGLRLFPVGQHKLFYRIEGGRIFVLRILHSRMSETGHLVNRA
jgi:toxin ParE1/3/4